VSDFLLLSLKLDVDQETARAMNLPVQGLAKSSSDIHSPPATVHQ